MWKGRRAGGTELGVFGSDGWFAKHSLGDDIAVPQDIENNLKDIGIDDVTSDNWKRPRMKYVSVEDGVLSAQAYFAAFSELAEELPPGARAFATDPAHYDFYSRRCVKDLTLGPITHEIGYEAVDVQIVLASSGLKHDEWLVLRYLDVSSLAVDVAAPSSNCGARFESVSLDEILPHPYGCSHEIAFWDSSVRVVCRDLTAEWVTKEELARRA